MASMPKVDVTLKIDGHVTEREAVLRERRACARARCAALHELHYEDRDEKPCALCIVRAELLHPLPKIERRRVLRDIFGVSWWMEAPSHIPVGSTGGPGSPCSPADTQNSPWKVTGERIDIWSSLRANPTDLVDDDGSAGGSL